MNLTPHQAKDFAHDLTRRTVSGMNRLPLCDGAVDLNAHQIASALLALHHRLMFETEGA